MSELVAVEGDKESHGHGELDPSNNNSKFFVQGKRIALVGSNAAGDDEHHTSDETKPSEGSSKLFVSGIKVHRNNDKRSCGASTIVSEQSKLYSA